MMITTDRSRTRLPLTFVDLVPCRRISVTAVAAVAGETVAGEPVTW